MTVELYSALVLAHFAPNQNQIMLQTPVRDRKVELADFSIFLTQYGIRAQTKKHTHTHTHPKAQLHLYEYIHKFLRLSLYHTQVLFYLSTDDD